MNADDLLVPDWDAPAKVRAFITLRHGGTSSGSYTSLNLGNHVGDDPACVARNRALLRTMLPAEPLWLKQVHGTAVASSDSFVAGMEADAMVSRKAGQVCAVFTADCLPVLLCDDAGTVVAAVHAGWRGLAAGVIENAIRHMGAEPARMMAYLGPAIGAHAFEVGDEVRQIFVRQDALGAQAFVPASGDKWLADIYLLARQRLAALGMQRIYGGGFCTHSEKERFFSYRRDGNTGRMASLVWLAE